MSELDSSSENVNHIQVDGKDIYIVGTAHISRKSVELAEEVIKNIVPDSVGLELCESRYQSIRNPQTWKQTDIIQVIKQGRAYALFAQLLLAGYQKKLGKQLNVRPGEEMIRSAEVAEQIGSKIVLIDRDIKVTLRRVWAGITPWSFIKLLISATAAMFSSKKLDESEIEKLKSGDALQELMKEFTQYLPDIRKTLIDERDKYLAAKIRTSPGNKIVAVVGAGHVPGIKALINEAIDISTLEEIPESNIWMKRLGWILPSIVLLLFIGGFFLSSPKTGTEMILSWILITGLFSALGALLSIAHPVTILVSFLAAPLTTIHPLLAAGWFAGLSEAWLRKPKVEDFETVLDDLDSFWGVWRNRVLRILLVVILVNVAASIGAIWGAATIFSLLQSR